MISTIASVISITLTIFFFFISNKKYKADSNSIEYKNLGIVQNILLIVMFICSGIIVFLNQSLALMVAFLCIFVFIIRNFLEIILTLQEIEFIKLKDKLGLK